MLFNSCYFSYGNDETQTQHPLISRRKVNLLCFSLGIRGFWVRDSSLLINTMLLLDFLQLCLVEIQSGKQKSWLIYHSIVTWSNNSFHHWCFFPTQPDKCFEVKGALSGLRQILATESLKDDEKYFLFHLKSSFRSQDI